MVNLPSKYQEIKEYGSNMNFVQCNASEVFLKEQHYFCYVTAFDQTGNMSVKIVSTTSKENQTKMKIDIVIFLYNGSSIFDFR